MNKIDLIKDAINSKYKKDAEDQVSKNKTIIHVIRRLFGRKYAKAAQILDGKVWLYGYEISDARNYLSEPYLYIVDVGIVHSLAEFGQFLEKKYGEIS